MTYQFAVSPDVHARDLSNWFVLNTRIQRATGEAFRLAIHDDFSEFHRAGEHGALHLVFANAADTALLVRQHGFSPIARPAGVSDEAAVVVPADSPIRSLADLPGELRVALTNAPDVERICRILLEPADLAADALSLSVQPNFVLVAKALLTGEAQAGFLLRAALDEFSEVLRRGLRPLVSSRIYVISHALLASPSISHLHEAILATLETMSRSPSDRDLLAGLGAPQGWQRMSAEEAELMIDLMDTLAS